MTRLSSVLLLVALSVPVVAQVPSALIGPDGQSPHGTSYRPHFSGISISGAADIEIVIGNHTAIFENGKRIRAKLIEKGVLQLNGVGDYRIVVPSLDLVSVKGAADVTFLRIDGDIFTIDVKGACDATLSGRVRTLVVNVKGAADLMANGLRANTARVTVQGAAEADLWVTGRLFVTVNGVADVTYRGDPWRVKTDINGQGDVTKRD